MTKILLRSNYIFAIALIINLLGNNVNAQTTLASQSFEGSGTWNYTPNPATYNVSGDVWGIVSSLSSITPTDGSNFWGMQDLENANGGGAFYHVLNFEEIDVIGYTNIQLSFDYNVIGYDSADNIRYVIVVNGVDVVTTALSKNGSGTIDYNVTSNFPNAESVGIRIEARQNGGSDYAGVDNFELMATILNSNDTTSTVNNPTTQVAGTTVDANNVNTELNAVDVFSFEIEDNGNGDNLPTNVIQMRFTPGNNNTLLWGEDLQGVTLYNGSMFITPSDVIIENTELILEFDDTPVSIPDNDVTEFTLGFYINENDIADNDIIQVEIDATEYGFNADLNGSGFSTPYASSNITGNLININVEATRLEFLVQPTDVNVDEAISPEVQVGFVDDNGNVDSTYTGATGTVNLTTNGSFDASTTNSVDAVDGIAYFDNLIFDTEQSGVDLTATHGDGTIPFAYDSNTFNVTATPEIIAIQDFDSTAPEWMYSSDVVFFDNGADGYFGILDNSSSGLNYPNLSGNILFENDLDDEGDNGTSGFANLTFDTIELENYDSVTFSFDYDIVGYNANTDDVKYQLYYDGVGQGDVLLLDGGVDPVDAQGTVSVSIPDSVEEVYFVLSIRNNGADGYSGFDNFQLEGLPDTPQSFVFEDGIWVPENPQGVSESDDDITIVNGTVIFNGDVKANNLQINSGASLEIQELLEISGDITNNGELTFVSISELQTGVLGELNPTSTVTGDVTVERYIPSRRAFRFLTSAVTTSTSINNNWQEGVNNTGTNFPSDNQNPNPGYGIHITGDENGTNGFDATPSGNPSLFSFDNVTQTWGAITNTNVNQLNAGDPYRVLVRGDRSTNVTDNEASSSETIIRSTGTLATGTVTLSNMSNTAGEFNFFGNPYQATVDIFAVLNNSTNINTAGYYTWESDLSTQGAYVYIEDDGTVTPSGSNANTYLQPGQAAFAVTATTAGGTSLVFEESHKADDSQLTEVFRQSNISNSLQIVGNLYSENSYNNNLPAADGFRIKFSNSFTNSVDLNDGVKPFNIDENFGVMNGTSMFIVEERALPIEEDEIQLFNNNYRTTNYVLVLDVADFDGVTPYLQDNFTSSYTELTEGENAISFTVNENNTSFDSDRFKIVFSTDNLSTDTFENSEFVLYPNPVENESLFIEFRSANADIVKISVYNMLGKQVYNSEQQNLNSEIEIKEAQTWQSGVYIVKLNDGQQTITQKVIKK
ncbi:T9SS type A sorting domain-containing protein [Mesonia sp.]|uniref:T9SS type A sorting domain-containing protein n=1 Tax=Mesonia sp. TaxID=1960830 RepID=UPI00175CB65B|nr:T9SS type A sorting domain-containing protein [Mesonia sp.]HIB36851.1 T9SS type A sorting domain-containing protein [Mesonia sp.]